MAKVLNTYEQADFERLAAFYPYRNEHGLPVLEESLEDYAKRTNQSILAVRRQADRSVNRIFALSCGDNQFGQDFTLYEALRTVDRLLRGQSFIKQADL
ncbi:DUF4761 family protein [Escherichia coli]|uniref:DUF4761 family protein n=1 Tax=Escherichia coli TaxID=562 RepID=UPI000DE09B75|nr:DUF4761 family protein [Escherichia coli]HAL3318825.1 DUF4761 family protein [Escherichia coli]